MTIAPLDPQAIAAAAGEGDVKVCAVGRVTAGTVSVATKPAT